MIEIRYKQDISGDIIPKSKISSIMNFLKELSTESDFNIIEEMMTQYKALKRKKMNNASELQNIKVNEPDELDLMMIESIEQNSSKKYYSLDEIEQMLDMED